MNCAEVETLIGASLDGELDAPTAVALDTHVASCPNCSATLEKLQWLRAEIAAADVDWSATADLRRLAAAVRRKHARPWWKAGWLREFAVAGAAAVLTLAIAVNRFETPRAPVERQIVDSHIRSLQPEHLVDVPSSDRHTVKPWFQGKLSFAPPVPDLGADGFELVGGRLDVIGGRPAAAIVYKRRNHVINVWIAPADGAERRPESSEAEGFHVVEWQRDRMRYWVVSDLNAAELSGFAGLLRSR